MTDGSTDGLEVFRKAFGDGEQPPLTEAQTQVRRNAAGFALTVFGYGRLNEPERQANLGVNLTEEQLEAAKKFREEHGGNLTGGYMSTVLGETIPFQLSLTKDLQTLSEERKAKLDIVKDPTGISLVQHIVNRAEDDATQAVMKSQGKKEEAEMLYRLLVKKTEGLPKKPISLEGDADEETVITREFTDALISAFGGNASPQARAISKGIDEIYERTGYRLEEDGLVVPQVKTTEKVRGNAQLYKEAVDFFLAQYS
jgi:hypothetical protein